MNVQVVLFAVVILGVILTEEAFAKRDKGRRQSKNAGCSEWTYEECVPKKGQCGKGKKQGTRTGENCQLTTKQFKCKVPCEEGDGTRCQYNRGEWSECDAVTNQRSITMTLKEGSHGDCEQTKMKTKKCKDDDGEKKDCKYSKGMWTECTDGATTKTRVDTLLKAAPGHDCEQTRTLTKKCKQKKN